MISYAAYCSTQAMHNCAHEVAKDLINGRDTSSK